MTSADQLAAIPDKRLNKRQVKRTVFMYQVAIVLAWGIAAHLLLHHHEPMPGVDVDVVGFGDLFYQLDEDEAWHDLRWNPCFIRDGHEAGLHSWTVEADSRDQLIRSFRQRGLNLTPVCLLHERGQSGQKVIVARRGDEFYVSRVTATNNTWIIDTLPSSSVTIRIKGELGGVKMPPAPSPNPATPRQESRFP